MTARDPHQPPEPAESPTLFPNDHLRMLIELLRPSGAELARRWVAVLLLVPTEEREAVVASIERRIAELYADPADDEPAGMAPAETEEGASDAGSPMLHVASDPVQREGYVEQEIRTYGPTDEPEDSADVGEADDEDDREDRSAAG